MSRENVEVAREGVARFSESDMEGLAELYAFARVQEEWDATRCESEFASAASGAGLGRRADPIAALLADCERPRAGGDARPSPLGPERDERRPGSPGGQAEHVAPEVTATA